MAGLIDRNRHNLGGLAHHGLAALAAELLEARAAPVPDALRPQLERTRVMDIAASSVLGRVREACVGSILLVKGPEVAARYPHGARGYGDLDLFAQSAAEVQRQLRGAGFEEMPDPEGALVGFYHLPPLRWRGSLYVEVHTEPKWPNGLRAPSIEELLDAAVPSRAASEKGVEGILAPAPAHHALLLAAHAWAHQPLGRARDLIDVGAFRIEADASETRAIARRWGMARLWETTERAVEGLLRREWPLAFRVWAGHMPELRERTVVAGHLERLCSPIWAYPPRVATRRIGRALLDEVRPAGDEGWGEKLGRSFSALSRPFASIGEHHRLLSPSAKRGTRNTTSTAKRSNREPKQPRKT